MSNQNVEIANTILQQLGAGRFKAMTGANGFIAIERGLSMKVGRNSSGVVYVRIVLSGADLYDVQYLTRAGRVVAESRDVYCDRLQADFTANTGMYTHL